ncbi:hypothetical protein AB0M20_08855 [Actinoplanes sp. NPDC051633]|uniref:hypothetical protein n=1 Tax=Actinoplanes sp. NPDC051633 TaxID=3155670 RepID=UPI003443FF70
MRWRDAFRTGTDLAVVGFAVLLAALPLVTAGAALLTASRAIGRYLETDSWPPGRLLWADFRRSLLPGLAASAVFVVVAGLIVLDVLALRSGRVPGGPPAMAAVAVAGLLIAGLSGLALVIGPRAALRLAGERPGTLAGAAAVASVALTLAVLIHPVLIPVLLGHTMFAMHVLASRVPQRSPA